jgi:hypothetical protein
MAMAISRLTLAAVLVLGLGLSTLSGHAQAAPVNPIAAFNDFYRDSKPTGYLLGASAGGQWLKPEAAAGLIPGSEQYRLYTLTGEAGNSVGGKPTKGEDACADTLYVTLAPYPSGRGSLVAVAGPWNALPRKLKAGSTQAQVYREAAAEILRSKGIDNPKINLTQVIQVDLDGDGVEEVLVSATNYARFNPEGGLTPDARAGDYSLVFLRKVVEGKVVTKIITGEYYPMAKKFTAPAEHRIIGVLDLNGDGSLEIVLSGRYYEGDWAEAYRVQGTKIIKLFNMGCGH